MNKRSLLARGQLVAQVLNGCWRQTSAPVTIAADELESLTPLLSRANLSALGWWRIRDTELAAVRGSELLREGFRFQTLQSILRREKIELVHQVLAENNLEAILVKGLAAARFYAQPNLRPLGDIDLLVRPADYQRARLALKGERLRSCWIDLHYELKELDDRSTEDLFARSQTFKLGAQIVRSLGPEDHLEMLTIHFLKHAGWWPVWLCDVAALLDSITDGFDWDLCIGTSGRRSSWRLTTIALAAVLLEANLNAVPFRLRIKTMPRWLRENVLQQWSRLLEPAHLPVQPRPLMAQSWSSPRKFLREVRERWPDPVTATFALRGSMNGLPRLPYQMAAFTAQTIQYLAGAKTNH